MSTKTPLLPKLNRQTLEEASEWFVEFRVGDADAAARKEFDQWLRRSPEHIRAYLEIARSYHELKGLDREKIASLAELASVARAAGNVVSLGMAAPSESLPRPDDSRRRISPRIPMLLGAGALAAGVMIWIALPGYTTYSTGVDESRMITMADGSTITLDARTELRVRYTKAERDIDLVSGQAFFQVARNRTRPFVVRSGFAVVKDVGTEFAVDHSTTDTTVTVVEGRVAVYSARRPPRPTDNSSEPGVEEGAALLAAGEQAVVSDHEISTQTYANVAVATSWMKHRFVFDGSPLSDVVHQFNRYNTSKIYIDDPALKAFRISGVYSSTDPDSFLRFVRAQPGVEVTRSEGAIHIRRK